MFDVQTAVEPVLRQFRHPPGVVELVSPIGIPAEAAAGIMTACAREPGERVLVLTCTSSRTAIRYIRRASCVNHFYQAADPPGLVEAGNVDQLFGDPQVQEQTAILATWDDRLRDQQHRSRPKRADRDLVR
jgi:hypothetical protein